MYLSSIAIGIMSAAVLDRPCVALSAAGLNIVIYLASISWIAWQIRRVRVYIETEFKGFHLCSNGHVIVRQEARKYVKL